jgi:hypothetical protein
VGQEPQTGDGGAGVLIVMLPLPPKGVALSVGAATALVRTAHVGALRLTDVGAVVDVRPMIRPAQTTNAAMTLASNALLLMMTPMFARCSAWQHSSWVLTWRPPHRRNLVVAPSSLRARPSYTQQRAGTSGTTRFSGCVGCQPDDDPKGFFTPSCVTRTPDRRPLSKFGRTASAKQFVAQA